MRLSIIIFLIFLASCSNYTRLDGTYFSNKQDCFILDGKDGLIEAKDQQILSNIYLKQTKNKLKFRSITLSPYSLPFKTHIYKRHVRKYYFKLLYKTEDSFMVSPVSRLSKKYFNNRDSITFKTKYQFADPTNYFTKIIYHSGRCFGYCNDLHLELDYSGNLKVTDNGNDRKPDTVKNDNYFGKVSFEDLERLKTILKYSQLKTLVWPASRRCYDFPDLTLILYQNEKRYYFKMNAACLPVVSMQLTRFLSDLFKYNTLNKVDTTFTYER